MNYLGSDIKSGVTILSDSFEALENKKKEIARDYNYTFNNFTDEQKATEIILIQERRKNSKAFKLNKSEIENIDLFINELKSLYNIIEEKTNIPEELLRYKTTRGLNVPIEIKDLSKKYDIREYGLG